MPPRCWRFARATGVPGRGTSSSVEAHENAGASCGNTVAARVHAERELTDEAVAQTRNGRRFFEREKSKALRGILKKPAERTSLATGKSCRTVTRVSQHDSVERARPSGTPERRQSLRRIPQEEYALVRGAIYLQYRERRLPTLKRTLDVLRARSDGGSVGGSGPQDENGDGAAMDEGNGTTRACSGGGAYR